MRNSKCKILFFGSSNYVLPIIEALNINFDLSLVVTTEKNPKDPVSTYCKKNNITFISVSNSTDLIIPTNYIRAGSRMKTIIGRNLKSLRIESSGRSFEIRNLMNLAVVADFRLIIPLNVLNLFSKGVLNIHPSLLPEYRGPTPGQTAILNGDKKSGVTIIKLDEKIDHGQILIQKEENIPQDETGESLYQKLFRTGAQILPKTINDYINGKIQPKEQDHEKATFTRKLTRQDGFIDTDNPPSKETIERMIRAYYPWPSVWFKWQITDKKWKIIKLLPNEKIQVEGKKPMSYKDFINGYKDGKEILRTLNIL